MATRALICYLDEDRELTVTYNHYDGYPDHLGKILDEHYDGDMYAEKIANHGSISYIDEDGNIEDAGKRSPEKVKLSENWEDALYEITGIIASYQAEYAYIWWTGDGVWVEIKNTGQRSMVDQLANRMVSAKNIFPIINENINEMKEDKKDMMKSVINILKTELDIDRKDALNYISLHKYDLFDGTVNAYDTEEVLDDYNEFRIINTEYVGDVKEEDNVEIDYSDATAGDDAIERESASGAFEEVYNARGETLKEHFKRLTK